MPNAHTALSDSQRSEALRILAAHPPVPGESQAYRIQVTNTLLSEGCGDEEILALLDEASLPVSLTEIREQRERVFAVQPTRCVGAPQFAAWRADNRALVYRGKRGRVAATAANLQAILQEDTRFSGALSYDHLAGLHTWVKDVAANIRAGAIYRQSHASTILCFLNDPDTYAMDGSSPTPVEQALFQVAEFYPRNEFLEWVESHPVRTGTSTIDATLDSMSVPESDRWMLHRTLLSIYRRAKEPGCKVDPLLVLRGGREFVEHLVPNRFYLKLGSTLDERGLVNRIRGRAIGEIGRWRVTEGERVVATACGTHDRFKEELRERLIVFISVTDPDFHLAERWGKRVWFVDCFPPRVTLDDQWRAQLWGEVRGLL
jgi:Virulence-associated protein E